MAKEILKNLFNLNGFEVKRYNKQLLNYKRLFKKYKDFTMIPEDAFLLNLELCSKFKHIDGDFVECGVWRGGMSGAIAEKLPSTIKVHLFDSFEGLPAAQEVDGKDALRWQSDTASVAYYDNCSADETFANKAMIMAGHSNFKLWKGWFEKTVGHYDGDQIAILRLDGDWYDSIKTCLDGLFPKVAEGGLVILDDYHTWDGCAKAVHDYLSDVKSPSRIYQWKNRIAYIVKKS